MSERTPFVPSGQSVIIFSSGSILGQQQLLMLDVADLVRWPQSFVDDPFGKLMSILRPIEYIFDDRTDQPIEADVANIISGGITCSEQLRYFVRRAGFGQIQLGVTVATSNQPTPSLSMVRFDFTYCFTPTLPEFRSPFTKFFRKKIRHFSKRSDDSILEMASNPSYLRSFLVVVNRLVPENYRATAGTNWSSQAFFRSCSFHGFRPSILRERNLRIKFQVGSELA